MSNEPRIETRPAQPYAGVRAVMAMRDFAREIPSMTAQVLGWLTDRGLRPSGQPFLRYHVIDMPNRMDVELGVPVAHAVDASDSVQSGELPAGRYAVLAYRGVKNGVPANKQLIDWITQQGEHAACHTSDLGDVFDGRYETQLTDASAEADQGLWEIEVAILLRG